MIISKPKKIKTGATASKRSCWFLFFYWVTLYFLLFSIFFIKASSELDPDLGWHLSIGKEIFVERQAPSIEKITYPTLGQYWVDHEWLSNLLFYSIYAWGGNYGNWFLSFVFSFLLLGTFHLSIRAIKQYLIPNVDPMRSAFFISFAILAALFPILTFFGNRVQVISWFLLSLSFYIFAKVFVEKKYLLLFAFPFLFALWANLHGSFIFGIGALTIFCFLALIKTKTTKERLIVLTAAIASFAATLLNPYHIELWKLIAGEYTSNRSYLENIVEWLPIYSPFRILWIPSLYIALFISLFSLSKPTKLLKSQGVFSYAIFCFFMLILAIKARRFIPFFAFSSFPLIVLFLNKIFFKPSLPKKILILLLLPYLVLSIFFYLDRATLPKDIFSIQSEVSPKDAVSLIRSDKKLRKMRILNDYNWGGYLSWVWPGKQIFIDGRMPQRPLDSGLTFFEEYLQFHKKETLENKLEEYSIEIVLLQNRKSFSFKSKTEKLLYEKFFFITEDDFQEDHFLVDYLEENWEKLYEDQESLVFTRQNSH